jgi:hypothetical protein
MTEDCGHHCCHIRRNGYHVHASEPAACDRCVSGVLPRVAALTDQLVHAGARPDRHAPEARDAVSRTTSTATTSSCVSPVE